MEAYWKWEEVSLIRRVGWDGVGLACSFPLSRRPRLRVDHDCTSRLGFPKEPV